MYPNYSKSQQPPQFSSNYVPPQQPYLQPQQPPSFLMPPQNNTRAVFSSMIQPQSNNTTKSAGLSKL